MVSIRGILFDLDGTLLDTYDLILSSMRHTTTTVLGEDFSDEVLMHQVGTPLEAQMKFFTPDPELQDVMLTTYRAHNHQVHDECVRTFPGVPEALQQLKAAGVRMGVVTSKRHALAQRGLDVCGLNEFMEFLVGPDDFPAHKPDPGPVRYGCELMGLLPEEVLYVGDSPFDIQAGNGAGCSTVAVLWGMFSREALEAENPTYELERSEELAKLLELGAA